MGNFVSLLPDPFGLIAMMGLAPREHRIVMVGLDAAGKTTILYKLKLGEVTATVPTIGFNVETVEYNGISFTVWDVGGQDRLRALWRHYYQDADALIYVVDSNDVERLDTAAEELAKLQEDRQLSEAVLLVFANKQDLPQAVKPGVLADKFGLSGNHARKWYVQACVGTTGDGIYEGFEWLSKTLRAKESGY